MDESRPSGSAVSDTLERLQLSLADRYDVKRVLGRGGMATVYLAEDRKYGRRVAVKVMEPGLVGEVGIERFLRETQVAARLSHPHILTVFESGEADGLLYYVMPYVEGESLRDLMHREKQLSIDEAVRITREVADALTYAHSQGVVHRDIKPENILLGTGHAVVTDFGIARAVLGAPGGAQRLTQTGLAVGTPTYMSPEQWGGEQNVDGRADQYSLACVLYEMLVGEPPFTGATPMVVMARHSMETVPQMRIVRPNVSLAAELAVTRALGKVPADRYPSVAEFADALTLSPEEALRQATRTAGGSTLGAAHRHGSNPALIAAMQAEEQRRRAPMRRLWWAVGVLVVGLLAGGGGFLVYRMRTRAAAEATTRLVVIPFTNIGRPDKEYFADGLTEEVISRLSGIKDLSVVARTTAMKYKGGGGKTVSEIAKELGASHVMEGSVRWLDSTSNEAQALIRVKLFTRSDTGAIWSGEFPITNVASDVFRIQQQIAEHVAAKAIGREIAGNERARVNARPTLNAAAYEAFQRANFYYNRSWDRPDVDSALAKYQEATRLDGKFALAFAFLGRQRAWKYQLGYDPTPDDLTQSKAAIDSALVLAPELPEAHLARGLYLYYGRRLYDEALKEFGKVREALPGYAVVHNVTASVFRRLGRWNDAIASYKLAAELDPKAHVILFNLAEAELFARDYLHADVLADSIMHLDPQFLDGHILKATLAIQLNGDVAGANRIIDSTAKVIPPARWRPTGHHWRAGLFRIANDTKERADERTRLGYYGLDTAHYLINAAEKAERFGSPATARIYYDSARAYLLATLAKNPGRAPAWGHLSDVDVAQGRPADAIREAEKAVAGLPVERDGLDGPEWVINLARVYARAGMKDSAITWLQRSLDMGSRVSPRWIGLDPVWAPLRSDPRFQQLLKQPPKTLGGR
jgi:TolB-like protein